MQVLHDLQWILRGGNMRFWLVIFIWFVFKTSISKYFSHIKAPIVAFLYTLHFINFRIIFRDIIVFASITTIKIHIITLGLVSYLPS